jgi:hypothetical protein
MDPDSVLTIDSCTRRILHVVLVLDLALMYMSYCTDVLVQVLVLIVSPKTRLWFLVHAPDRVRNFWTEKMGWSGALTPEVSDDI